MGSISTKQIKPDIQSTLDQAIIMKEAELATCEKEIEELIQEAVLYRVLELNLQVLGQENRYRYESQGALGKLREQSKLRILLTKEIQGLNYFREKGSTPLTDQLIGFSRELMNLISGSTQKL
jgi:hypothetical protein